jgi:hypothetical protein
MDAHFGHVPSADTFGAWQADTSGIVGELGTDPCIRDRKADRRHVDVNAGLRQRGAAAVTIHVHDLSTHGFRASTHLELLPGTDVWLKLPGLEAWHSKVAWMDGHWIGCAFERPLHPAVLDNILRSAS